MYVNVDCLKVYGVSNDGQYSIKFDLRQLVSDFRNEISDDELANVLKKWGRPVLGVRGSFNDSRLVSKLVKHGVEFQTRVQSDGVTKSGAEEFLSEARRVVGPQLVDFDNPELTVDVESMPGYIRPHVTLPFDATVNNRGLFRRSQTVSGTAELTHYSGVGSLRVDVKIGNSWVIIEYDGCGNVEIRSVLEENNADFLEQVGLAAATAILLDPRASNAAWNMLPWRNDHRRMEPMVVSLDYQKNAPKHFLIDTFGQPMIPTQTVSQTGAPIVDKRVSELQTAIDKLDSDQIGVGEKARLELKMTHLVELSQNQSDMTDEQMSRFQDALTKLETHVEKLASPPDKSHELEVSLRILEMDDLEL